MFKNIIGNLSARLLRAAIGRVSSDIELIQTIHAATSTSIFVNSHMPSAMALPSRQDVISFALQTMPMQGFICELGVYRGESLNYIAKKYCGLEIYGFDTFTGLPENWRPGYPQGAFDLSDENLEFEKNCVLYKGLFIDTLPKFLKENNETARFIHIDCDLYTSTITALTLLAARMVPGTIILFDEFFNYPGWENHEYKAFQKFVSINNICYEFIAYNKFGQQVAVRIT